MKKILVLIMSAMIAFSASACGGNGGDKKPLDGIEVAAGYIRYDVGESKRKTEGFGTQFDTLIVEKQNGLTEEEWQVHVDALKTMNLQNVRVRFYPEMYERGNDNADPNSFDYDSPNVDFNSLEMQHLYKILDAFEENGVKVDLSWYGCRTTFKSEDGKIDGSWLGGKYGNPGIDSWCMAPSLTDHPKEEFAESVAACLNYLVKEKKYTCINEYSLFPEPEGVIRSVTDFKAIAELVEAKLKAYGIRDKFLYSGPADYGNNPDNYDTKYLSKMKFDKATSSVYPFNNESTNAVMTEFAANYAAVCDKYGISWGIAECGTSNFLTAVSNSDSDKYERAIFMARFLVNMLNGGCTNIKYFIFGDCGYDGVLNTLGLFKFKSEQWKAKPVWYSWSLICRYTDIGSDIFPITTSYGENDDPDISVVALKLPDGSWTYIATNSALSSKKIAIVNGRDDRAEKMNIYRVSGSSIPSSGALEIIPSSDEVDVSAGVAYVSVPAQGFVVLSNKK